jgi:hypothetical protein
VERPICLPGDRKEAREREFSQARARSLGLVLLFHSLKEEAYVFELFIG